ncbi:MAG TPA: formate dehydrogenase accessory sulfurtransferase FdhD, partial [Mycobacteriales bacterium]|nr:formate dehydrogenase accessory sulfurtransferase FdhD [Mycobacteriales bacterium]
MGRVTATRKVLRLADSSVLTRPDTLVVEEPLEIRVGGAPLTVTMRTPGDDFDLVPGFLVAEGAVARAEDVVAMRYCPGATDDGATTYNVIDVIPAPGVVPPAPRAQLTTSACGVCGTASIDLVRARTRWPVNADPVEVAPATLAGLPETLRATQQVFERTGGLHAAGLFMANGVLVCLREDVGRHNAADK